MNLVTSQNVDRKCDNQIYDKRLKAYDIYKILSQ